MATYTPYGKPHSILERLVESDCGYLALANICGVTDKETRRETLWFILGAMLKAELIGGRRARYYLREPGRQMLDALRAGKPVTIEEPVQSVKLFA